MVRLSLLVRLEIQLVQMRDLLKLAVEVAM
jgi:hypothetical protein